MIRILVAAAVLLALAGGAAYWTLARDDDRAEAGVQVVRWGNITVQVSEDSGVAAVRGFAPAELKPPAGGQVLILTKADSRLVIDADTAKVIQDTVQSRESAAIGQVFATLAVQPFDEKTAPWPYGTTVPITPRERWGNITFMQPDPASGLAVYLEEGDTPEGGYRALQLKNGRSTLAINADTGAVYQETTTIAREDEEAFARFLASVQYGRASE